MASEVRCVVAMTVGEPVSVATMLVPDPGQGEAVVKVQAYSVWHTDLHFREGGINDEFPFLHGHGDETTIGEAAPHLPEWLRDRA
jgi:S-(hydroxymethyl)mycothiol dehydrogenase